MRYALQPEAALHLVDTDPGQALNTALSEAEVFAHEQRKANVPTDITLSDTYFYDAPELERDDNRFDRFMVVADALQASGWQLNEARARLNHTGAGAGLVLFRSGEVGTFFRANMDPDWQRMFGRICMRGNLIYSTQDGQAQAQTVEMLKAYRRTPAKLPKGARAGQLATQIFLGIYQRHNFQTRQAA